jgi:hypothetical protein
MYLIFLVNLIDLSISISTMNDHLYQYTISICYVFMNRIDYCYFFFSVWLVYYGRWSSYCFWKGFIRLGLALNHWYRVSRSKQDGLDKLENFDHKIFLCGNWIDNVILGYRQYYSFF